MIARIVKWKIDRFRFHWIINKPCKYCLSRVPEKHKRDIFSALLISPSRRGLKKKEKKMMKKERTRGQGATLAGSHFLARAFVLQYSSNIGLDHRTNSISPHTRDTRFSRPSEADIRRVHVWDDQLGYVWSVAAWDADRFSWKWFYLSLISISLSHEIDF